MNTGLPKGWAKVAGRVSAPAVSTARATTAPSRPRAAEPPPPPAPPEKDPNKADPEAAVPAKCAKCEADIPMMEPPAKFCPSCGEPVDGSGSEDATPPADALRLGRDAMVLAGVTSPEAARGTLAAWKEAAGTLTTVQDELVTAKGRLDVLERERVLERAVASGTLQPGEAWSFSVKDGQKARAFSAWAGPPDAEKGTGQSLEQLNAFIAQRGRTSKGPAASKPMTPAAPQAAPTAPPPRGIDPKIYEAARLQVTALAGGES